LSNRHTHNPHGRTDADVVSQPADKCIDADSEVFGLSDGAYAYCLDVELSGMCGAQLARQVCPDTCGACAPGLPTRHGRQLKSHDHSPHGGPPYGPLFMLIPYTNGLPREKDLPFTLCTPPRPAACRGPPSIPGGLGIVPARFEDGPHCAQRVAIYPTSWQAASTASDLPAAVDARSKVVYLPPRTAPQQRPSSLLACLGIVLGTMLLAHAIRRMNGSHEQCADGSRAIRCGRPRVMLLRVSFCLYFCATRCSAWSAERGRARAALHREEMNWEEERSSWDTQGSPLLAPPKHAQHTRPPSAMARLTQSRPRPVAHLQAVPMPCATPRRPQ